MTTAAFQGEPGAFSEEAALALCGDDCAMLPCRTFEAVVSAVESGRALYGVLPVENSSIGIIKASNAVLNASSLVVVREIILPIHQHLLALPGATVTTLKRALSHPAALAQCSKFFEQHMEIMPTAWYDTAGAAREISTKKDATSAAVGARRAAVRYGLEVLQEQIEDNPDNRTRFVLVKKDTGR